MYGMETRHCCARSDGQAGSGVLETTPWSTGSRMLDGIEVECAMSYVTVPGKVVSSNSQLARLSPGVSTVRRMAEPARKTWPNAGKPMRAAVHWPGTSMAWSACA